MRSITGPSCPWFAASIVLAAAFTTGCGDRIKPVINPVNPTGPSPEPTSYAIVLSQPNFQSPALLPSSSYPCPSVPYTSASVATVVDFSGDSILAQAAIGNGALTSAVDSAGADAYAMNCDGTITTIPISATLQTNQLLSTTLFRNTATAAVPTPPAAFQTNMLTRTGAQFVVNQNRGASYNMGTVGALGGTPTALLQEINVAPGLIALTGAATVTATGTTTTTATAATQRVYAISQGTTGSNVTFGACDSSSDGSSNTPPTLTTAGEVDGIEASTFAISSHLPVGICPVTGITTNDGLRTFILNRGNATAGSGTITVINGQTNALDTVLNPTGTIALGSSLSVGAGPVFAAIYPKSQLLVTANYDSNTVSFINIPLDVFGNDATGFGTVLATVPVGVHPIAVTILADGSRAYVANQGAPGSASGSVSVINLSSFTVTSTIPVTGHPRNIASTYNNPIGKVYTTAPDSDQLTIIRTDTDIISATITLQGMGIDVHTASQFAGLTTTTGTPVNTVISSHSPGSGEP